MHTLIIFDSWYGNTEQIARSIAQRTGDDTVLVNLGKGETPELPKAQLLIVGSPTHGGVATPAIQTFLKELPKGSLRGVAVAAFDTRVGMRWVKFIGFAGPRIAHELTRLGGSLIAGPEGFFVHGKTGPLLPGEDAHARVWGESIMERLQKHSPTVASAKS